MANKSSLVEGDVATVLRQFAIPMGFGLICIILVNVIDTYWVSKLGTHELAAMSLSFPVIGFITNISFGLMIGATTAISRTIGAGDQQAVKKITTHAIILGLIVVLIVTALGLTLQSHVFKMLGADDEILPLVIDYMNIWFIGSVLLIVPLVGNGALRASGDSKTPMVMMISAAIVNAILDPLFIFGGFGIEPMGIKGAAYATIAARFVGLCIIFGALFREKMIEMMIPRLSELQESWKSILSVGIPAIISNIMGPLATAMLTSMVAVYGPEAIAAYGIGARVDALLLIIPGALTGALSPFIGQNFGAQLKKRVAQGIQVSLNFVIVYGIAALVILLLGADFIASQFSSDPKVTKALSLYLMVVPIGYAAASTVRVATSAFNAVDHAFRSTLLSLLQSLFIAVPSAWLGSQFLGLEGIFLGLVIAAFVSSLLGIRWLGELLHPELEIRPDKESPLCENTSRDLLKTPVLQNKFAELLPEVLAFGDVTLQKVRNDAVGFFMEERELAHLHSYGRLDIPLPLEVGENLIRLKIVEPHPQHDYGWYIHQMNTEEEVQQGIWLLFLAHSLVQIRTRGANHPVTEAEMDKLCIGSECRLSIISATERWGIGLEAS